MRIALGLSEIFPKTFWSLFSGHTVYCHKLDSLTYTIVAGSVGLTLTTVT